MPDILSVRRKIYQDRDRCVMKEGSAFESDWTKDLPKRSTTIVVMEGVLEYFTKEQVTTCLKMLCDSFDHGYLLAELHHPVMAKNTKHHDAVKYTNAQFQWGTKSGKEYLDIEPRLTMLSEQSCTAYSSALRKNIVEMRKHSFRAKLFAFFLPFLNNRLAVYKW